METMQDKKFTAHARKPVAEFDFDAWANLAQNDPERFEQMRRTTIDDLIAKMECRDDRVSKMRALIEQQRNDQPAHEVLPWMMRELSKSFSELNEDFASQVKRWSE